MALKDILFRILPLTALLGSVSCSAISYLRHDESQSVRYAVLISGQTDERFIGDMTLAYNFLLEHGFVQDNIFVLDGNVEGGGAYPVIDNSSDYTA